MKKILLPISMLSVVMTLSAQTHFSEDFNTGTLGQFTSVDNDGDGNEWGANDVSSSMGTTGSSATSNSWLSNVVLTPDNLLTSSVIDLTGASGTLSLSWIAGNPETTNNWWEEHYDVIISSANDVPSIIATPAAFTETLPSGGAMLGRSIDVSAFAGQMIYLTFRHYNCTDMNWLTIDDVVLKNVVADDAELAQVNLVRYAALNANTQLSLDVTNAGSNTITSLTVDWNDGTAHSQMINVNIPAGATVNVNHPDFVTYATGTEANITVDITNVNGNVDGDPSNNTGAADHNTVSQIVQKNVVIEEGTGTWCGWCPRGAVAMDYMSATYPAQFIGIAVHNGDPMTVTAYDNGAGFTGFPSSNADRAILDASVSQAAFESYYNARKDMIVPAGLSIVNSGSGNSVVLDVTATFYTPFAASNYRLAVVLGEDDVTGTSSGYNQTNYYAGGSNGNMGGYESLPDPVPAADMVYDHVGRALLGGYNGQANSVPAVITDGATVPYAFNYTVPAGQNRGNMYAVAMLIDQSNGEIVNAEKISIATLGLAETSTINMNVYPNPANENLNVAFEVEGDVVITLTDMQGRVVLTSDYSNLSGTQTIAIPVSDLVSGNYILSIAAEGVSYNESVIIK